MVGATPEQCRNAYAAGDIAFYNASRCIDTIASAQLIESKKKSLNTQAYVLIGVAVIATGALIYLSRSKK